MDKSKENKEISVETSQETPVKKKRSINWRIATPIFVVLVLILPVFMMLVIPSREGHISNMGINHLKGEEIFKKEYKLSEIMNTTERSKIDGVTSTYSGKLTISAKTDKPKDFTIEDNAIDYTGDGDLGFFAIAATSDSLSFSTEKTPTLVDESSYKISASLKDAYLSRILVSPDMSATGSLLYENNFSVNKYEYRYDESGKDEIHDHISMKSYKEMTAIDSPDSEETLGNLIIGYTANNVTTELSDSDEVTPDQITGFSYTDGIAEDFLKDRYGITPTEEYEFSNYYSSETYLKKFKFIYT